MYCIPLMYGWLQIINMFHQIDFSHCELLLYRFIILSTFMVGTNFFMLSRCSIYFHYVSELSTDWYTGGVPDRRHILCGGPWCGGSHLPGVPGRAAGGEDAGAVHPPHPLPRTGRPCTLPAGGQDHRGRPTTRRRTSKIWDFLNCIFNTVVINALQFWRTDVAKKRQLPVLKFVPIFLIFFLWEENWRLKKIEKVEKLDKN